MALAQGDTLGPYEILEPIGAGGMGEVYRARDTRLDRVVAIKVLPEHLSGSPELRQRLEREAKAVSSLSHPNVCALFDLGHDDGVDYLVMEFIDGESMAERLAKGPIPMDEVLPLAIQIADALETAHRAGIVHRDLKPGNIMLTRDGAKLLDFGLAKSETTLGGDPDLTFSPTVSQPLTAAGTIMGTYQYMAPEQLEGKEVDARTDIFSFGAVLYEMATGHRAFQGESQASLIGSIMHAQPQPASAVQPMIPPALDRIIQTSLAKDPDERLQTAHDVKLQLQWIAEGGSVAGIPAPVVARRTSRERFVWAAFATAAMVAALFAVAWFMRAPEPPAQTRFEVAIPNDLSFVGRPRISPDGRMIAFWATNPAGESRIWIRHMDNLEATVVSGAETTSDTRPIWSPDSRHIAYFSEGKLRKISVDGGPAQTICDANGADGTWSKNGDILFDGAISDPIRRVSAGGGVPEDVVLPNSELGHASVAWPEWLPDGRHFLYLAGNLDGESFLMAAEIGSDEVKQLMPVSSRVQYVEPGFLLYIRDDTLVAHPFNASSLEPTGDPRPIADHVGAASTGHAPFTASQNGTLVFNSAGGSVHQLMWRDRAGNEVGALGDPAAYATFDIGPDPNRIVFDVFDDQTENRDLWVHDLQRGVSSRFTFHDGSDRSPLWSPDGSRIAFSSPRGTSRDIFVKNASGAGQAEVLLEDVNSLHPCDWSRDGMYMVYMAQAPETGWDIWAFAPDGSVDPFPVVVSPFIDVRPVFSPDGRWLAYQSDESGRPEIYVQRFPEAEGKWQVSTAGGTEPVWSPDGREIFYLDSGQNLVSVQVEIGESFNAGLPETLFETRLVPLIQRNRYAVSSDGQKFLMLTPLDSQSNPPMTVVQNWPVSLDQ